MPINVFGSTSINTKNKIDTSSFVQKAYLRTNYIEINNEKDTDMKSQFRVEYLPVPISIGELI